MPISLGKISKLSPSVSHLLINHPEFHDQCWEIISSKINQGKEFSKMRPNVEVFLDPTTKEIIWPDVISPQIASAVENKALDSVTVIDSDGLVKIGDVNPETPTLSHVLRNHSRYSEKTWDIIFSAANKEKPYNTLPPGTPVYINPKTLELSFGKVGIGKLEVAAHLNDNSMYEENRSSIQTNPDNDGFAKKLTESVKSYLGRPYQKIDCYGLVVRGLEDLGVQYGGKGGLREHLTQIAIKKGLPINAFHNGEGLIEFAGNKLFDETFIRVKNAEQQANEVLNRIKPFLQEGALLSFSTPSRGHTGVISQHNGQWTYVNSGFIDHQVDGGKATKRVGEERLTDEIKNWFRLAHDNKTSLKVSAGIFDTAKLKDKAQLAVVKSSKEKEVI